MLIDMDFKNLEIRRFFKMMWSKYYQFQTEF